MMPYKYVCMYVYIHIYIRTHVHHTDEANMISRKHTQRDDDIKEGLVRVWGLAVIHCNALQRTATHCNTLQYTAIHCKHTTTQMISVLVWGRSATHCKTLQTHCDTHCNTLQYRRYQGTLCSCLRSLCNTLQHSKTMQHTATHCKDCNRQQHTATQMISREALLMPGVALHHVATHCNAQQHTTITLQPHCNTLQHRQYQGRLCSCLRSLCTTLQYTATHCNTLQHTATHYNSVQHRWYQERNCFALRWQRDEV